MKKTLKYRIYPDKKQKLLSDIDMENNNEEKEIIKDDEAKYRITRAGELVGELNTLCLQCKQECKQLVIFKIISCPNYKYKKVEIEIVK